MEFPTLFEKESENNYKLIFFQLNEGAISKFKKKT